MKVGHFCSEQIENIQNYITMKCNYVLMSNEQVFYYIDLNIAKCLLYNCKRHWKQAGKDRKESKEMYWIMFDFKS